jgi:hypothetical protein
MWPCGACGAVCQRVRCGGLGVLCPCPTCLCGACGDVRQRAQCGAADRRRGGVLLRAAKTESGQRCQPRKPTPTLVGTSRAVPRAGNSAPIAVAVAVPGESEHIGERTPVLRAVFPLCALLDFTCPRCPRLFWVCPRCYRGQFFPMMTMGYMGFWHLSPVSPVKQNKGAKQTPQPMPETGDVGACLSPGD